ncbi:MAG: type II toxin-antitoxin system RelE/ParE family toxin [Flavobacteriales bacterium]|nr:type II toxin-antitoxin system RelE/ParE family toxin [Flavobacteriales bacterium]
MRLLSQEIERTIVLIGKNPQLFQKTNKPKVRRVVVRKLNSIFFHIDESKKQVTIVSFFDNRQDPTKLRL